MGGAFQKRFTRQQVRCSLSFDACLQPRKDVGVLNMAKSICILMLMIRFIQLDTRIISFLDLEATRANNSFTYLLRVIGALNVVLLLLSKGYATAMFSRSLEDTIFLSVIMILIHIITNDSFLSCE